MAKELYQKLLLQDCIPEDVGNLASLLVSQNELNEAIALYEKYLPKWPSNYQLLFNGSNAYIKAGDINKAINLLRIAVSTKPNEFKAVRKLSTILLQTNKKQEGINIVEIFCQKNPNQGLAWLELGVIYFQLNAKQQALKAFENGSKILPKHLGLIANRLTLLKDLNQLEKAKTLYDSLGSKEKEDINIQGAWAGVLLKTDSTEEAANILTVLTTANLTALFCCLKRANGITHNKSNPIIKAKYSI